jgi:hypothetical protein
MAGGESTFKANFTADGVAALMERIRDKLNDLMEDYTDDTLVVSCRPLSHLLPRPPIPRSTL